MAREKKIITMKHRFFTKEEANTTEKIINEILKNKDYKIEKKAITPGSYTIQIHDMNDIDKQNIKREISELNATIYKTNDTWKEIQQRQIDREMKDHKINNLARA